MSDRARLSGDHASSARRSRRRASATFQGPGNTAETEVHSSKTTIKPKPLTRAQKLALALKACRKLKHKHKRKACERKARKRYGPKHKRVAKKTRASRTSARKHD